MRILFPCMEVIPATALSKALCHEINLGYLDPSTIDPAEYKNREDEGILVVPNDGEMLFRLADGTVPDIDEWIDESQVSSGWEHCS